jgi:hypothetical protein
MLKSLESALEELLRTYKINTYKIAGTNNNFRNKDNNFQKRQRIRKLEVVRRKTMYGMYLDEFLFIKATVYDPRDILRIASILQVRPMFHCFVSLNFHFGLLYRMY